MPPKNPIWSIAILIFLGASPDAFCSETNKTLIQKPLVDEKAERVVRRMADYYQSLKSFEGEHHIYFSNSSGSFPAGAERFAARRPNRFAITPENADDHSLTSDGTNVYEYRPYYYNLYFVTPAPLELEGITNGKPGFILQTIFSTNRYLFVMSGFTAGLKSLKHVGLEKVDGAECDHLQMVAHDLENDRRAAGTGDLWIASGDAPAFVKYSFVRNRFGVNPKTGEETMIELEGLTETIRNWKANTAVPEERFKFVPPAEAVRVNPGDKKVTVKKADGTVVIVDLVDGSAEYHIGTDDNLKPAVKATPP